MMQRRFSGAWASKAARGALAVPLQPPRDPEHQTPTPNVEPMVGMPLWVQTANAPTPSAQIIDAPIGVPIGGGGPIDYTPQSHEFGMAGGHPETVLESIDSRAQWQNEDLGSVAARRWEPKTDRDGSPQLFLIPDMIGDGDSPDTLQLERTGVGQPNDPYARHAKRQKRSWQRKFDMHWFEVEMRARIDRNAYTAQPQPPVPEKTQYDSPFWTAATEWMGSTDRFVIPSLRRSPRAWDVPQRADEMASLQASEGSEMLLPQWGL